MKVIPELISKISVHSTQVGTNYDNGNIGTNDIYFDSFCIHRIQNASECKGEKKIVWMSKKEQRHFSDRRIKG